MKELIIIFLMSLMLGPAKALCADKQQPPGIPSLTWIRKVYITGSKERAIKVAPSYLRENTCLEPVDRREDADAIVTLSQSRSPGGTETGGLLERSQSVAVLSDKSNNNVLWKWDEKYDTAPKGYGIQADMWWGALNIAVGCGKATLNPHKNGWKAGQWPAPTEPGVKVAPPAQTSAVTIASVTLAQQKPFTREQVSKMVRAGLGDDSGAKLIEQRGIDFAPAEEFIQTLKSTGASEAFLKALGSAKSSQPGNAKNPLSADDYFNSGNAKAASGDWEGAIADYTRAIELKPSFPDAYYNRGNAKQVKGDVGAALADFSKAIELKPDLAAAYNKRGEAKQAAEKETRLLETPPPSAPATTAIMAVPPPVPSNQPNHAGILTIHVVSSHAESSSEVSADNIWRHDLFGNELSYTAYTVKTANKSYMLEINELNGKLVIGQDYEVNGISGNTMFILVPGKKHFTVVHAHIKGVSEQ